MTVMIGITGKTLIFLALFSFLVSLILYHVVSRNKLLPLITALVQ